MIRDSKAFIIGVVMMVSFLGIYLYMMSPSFGNGRNGLEFADDLFNSISKGSVENVIGAELEKTAKFDGTEIAVELKGKDESQAERWSQVLQKVEGAEVSVNKEVVSFKGDLGKVFASISADCQAMFENNGDVIQQKYNTDPRDATNRWYNITKAMTKSLDAQESFKESLALQSYQQKVIEPAYNYYGVEILHVSEHAPLMTFMMVFYMVYTLWYGFAIYYLCQGLGITMSKSAKKAEA